MTLKEIREEAWVAGRETGEVDADRLWPKADMNRYINRVYNVIARETKCIRDVTTPSICHIASNVVDYTTYTPGTHDYLWANDPSSWLYHANVCPYIYPLDPRIIQIEEAKWTIQPWKLVKVSVTKWQPNVWWEQVIGMPTEYCTDLQSNTIAVNFRAKVNDILRLQVRRMPLAPLVADGDIPEIRTEYHDFFLNGVLELMFAKKDSQTFDVEKSINHGSGFLKDLDAIKKQESLLDNRIHVNTSLAAFR